MDGKINLSSYEWALYNVLKHELNTLQAKNEEPLVQKWLNNRIEKLRDKINETSKIDTL